jgi:hypothetical protein
MTEQELNNLPIDELFDLMIKRTSELIALTHSGHTPEFDATKKELQLIQRIIVEKRAEFRPG